MLRTIFWFIYFGGYMLLLLPKLWKVKMLEKQGKLHEVQDISQRAAKTWARRLIAITGTSVQVEGLENIPPGPVVFVSNHQGNFDIPLFLGYIDKPKAFIAKIELLKMPLVSSWMKNIRCIFIDRQDPRQSLRAINSGVDLLKDGHSLVIFPEGTRSRGPEMGEFKKGSLKLATKAGVPIVPVTINGTYRMMEANKGRIKPAQVKMIISSPIDTTSLTKEDENYLSDQVFAVIQRQLCK
ncbi:1-acyl-sn-glycerol-3-phosphate acyltransferase [Geosporobacter subterraneus DSM 17957]|uniref:1-acyl-sn-glycerol-3-phosphate acyltransferase n=1 Tax=Geosporobacter subterraneus DSM 17957 TaxID=1121919 RepID=A0A1M6KCE0_9FIRM|nr:lysophospholipid acyltransferase family protein [Geosporobacter subterraneus]SHJ56636.1 1-acyl-sn-glycerol-3-phosphate acyltransferase [Geosporobacter subterraneus DSM 17957]